MALALLLSVLIGFSFTACSTDSGNGGPQLPGGLQDPAGVSATAQSSSTIRISWDPVSGADYYDVFWSFYPDTDFEYDGTSTTTSFVSQDWTPLTTGYFKVKSVKYSGDSSSFSTVVYATTFEDGNEEPSDYTITYNINNGTGTTPSPQTANSGSSITLPSDSGFSRSGYTFSGWNTNSSGTGTDYYAGSLYTVTANTTLYAKWAAAIQTTYTVTYNINNGAGTTPSSQTVNAGSIITLPSDSGFSRSGYTFSGWNTNSSGTGTDYYAGSSYTVTGNITLYAKWTIIAAPSAPVISSITRMTNGAGLRISWGSVSTAAYYTIYKSNSKYGSFMFVTTTPNTITIYDDTVNLSSPGAGYYYQITAVNSSSTESAKSAARGVTLPSSALVCFYTPTYTLLRSGTIANRTWQDRQYYTGYYVTIGSIEYYDSYSRGPAYTSLDSSVSPGTYSVFQTKYKYQSVKVWNNSTPDDVMSSGTSNYVDRGSLTLKIGYHYMINAKDGTVTTTDVLTMD
jgi:uncharacterized repeat protein (TIGR02543 family)